MQKVRVKRSFKRVKIIGAVLVVLLVAILGCHFGRQRAHEVEMKNSEEAITRVMILGVDRRADDAGRSDTLMVASVRMEQQQAALMSIPRDTRVKIKGHAYDKINHAYAYGGHELSRETVQELLGVPIDHYILIDTKAFERIIDTIGGVDIDVEKRMYYEDPWDDNGGLIIDLYPGEQHLDGDRAIQYVRYRDGEGDIGRIRRQQKFMRAVLAQVISPDILPQLPQLIEEIRGAVETDMSVSELVKLGILPPDYPLSVHSLTGYTGGGKKMIEQYEAPERDPEYVSPRHYGLTLSHKHIPEMMKVCGLTKKPIFCPIVCDFPQGMLVTVPLHLDLLPGSVTLESLRQAYGDFYAGQRNIRVMDTPDSGFLGSNNIVGTNDLHIFVSGNETQAIVSSQFDNLGKGASGAAVQNLNIMMGVDENYGL